MSQGSQVQKHLITHNGLASKSFIRAELRRKASNTAKMSSAFVTYLIVFCFFTQTYGASPSRRAPCEDSGTCLTLEEAKAKANEDLNKAVEEGMQKLNKIRMEGQKIRGQIDGDGGVSEVDEVAVRELINMVNAGSKAFEEALKQGKEFPVFECIADCELSSRKQYPPKLDQFRGELKSLQGEPLKKIDAILQTVTDIEKKLEGERDLYARKIKDSFSTIGVTFNRDQALKAFNRILKGSENLGQEFPSIVEKYNESTQGILKNCGATFAQVTQEATQCMRGCLDQ